MVLAKEIEIYQRIRRMVNTAATCFDTCSLKLTFSSIDTPRFNNKACDTLTQNMCWEKASHFLHCIGVLIMGI